MTLNSSAARVRRAQSEASDELGHAVDHQDKAHDRLERTYTELRSRSAVVTPRGKAAPSAKPAVDSVVQLGFDGVVEDVERPRERTGGWS